MAVVAAVAAPPERSAPSRAWCFTINNPARSILFPDGLVEGVKYLVYQLERGEQGTPHLQGYITLQRPQRRSWLQKIVCKTAEGESFHVFDRAALFVAKGNAEQNKSYCTKPDGRISGPWELGSLPKQGERTDLHEAAELLLKTGDIRLVDPAVFLKYASGCLKLAALAPPPRRDDLKIITIVGGTGIGKSYAVHAMFPDIYVVNMGNSGLWWDGYTGQRAVLFEEFKGQVQLQKMLQILDPYPLRLEIKGGLVPARFTIVFITSNYNPEAWYRNDDGSRDAEFAALRRRLDVGNPVCVPPLPDGPRYIHVDSRDALHQRLSMLRAAGIIKVDDPAAAPVAAAAAPVDEEEAADVARPCTPILVSSDDEEAPRLKRAVAHITTNDVRDDADTVPPDEPHSPSWYAPQP